MCPAPRPVFVTRPRSAPLGPARPRSDGPTDPAQLSAVLLDDLVVDQLPERLVGLAVDDVDDVGVEEAAVAVLERSAQRLHRLVQHAPDAHRLPHLPRKNTAKERERERERERRERRETGREEGKALGQRGGREGEGGRGKGAGRRADRGSATTGCPRHARTPCARPVPAPLPCRALPFSRPASFLAPRDSSSGTAARTGRHPPSTSPARAPSSRRSMRCGEDGD